MAGAVDINGEDSAIVSGISDGVKGSGGNITIDAGSFQLRDGAILQSSTYGTGNAGNIKVNAFGDIFLANKSYILSAVEAGGVGKGSDININAASLTMRDGAQLIAMIRDTDNNTVGGKGSAGNVNIKVTGAYG